MTIIERVFCKKKIFLGGIFEGHKQKRLNRKEGSVSGKKKYIKTYSLYDQINGMMDERYGNET